MNDFSRTVKTAWYGIKSHKNSLLILSIFCVFLLPVFTIIFAKSEVEYYSEFYPNALYIYGAFLAIVTGLVLPLNFFSFLYNRSEKDFYYAMPVKRSQYFWGYFASSAVIFIIPWTALTVIMCCLSEWGNNLWGPYLQGLGLFFVLYCSMVFAVTFCGSGLCAFVTFCVMNVLPIAVFAFPLTAAGVDIDAHIELLADKIMAITPISALTWYGSSASYGYIIPIQVAFGVLELVGAFFLFKYRKGESTMALAFSRYRYPYQYIVMLLAVMGMDAVIFSAYTRYYVYNMSDGVEINQNTPWESGDFWREMIFLSVVTVLVSFIILNMILEKNPRAAFSKVRHLFIFTGGYVVFAIIAVSVATSAIPHSVLPFTPKAAVVYVYGYQEITQSEYDEMKEDYHSEPVFSFAVPKEGGSNEKGGLVIAEYADTYEHTQELEPEYDYYYYKRVLTDAFTVTQKDKLKELVKLVEKEPTEYPDFIIFPSSVYTLSMRTRIMSYQDAPLSEGYTDFKVTFIKDGKGFEGDVQEKDLDKQITDEWSHKFNYSSRGLVSRIGFAKDPSMIRDFKDYSVILSQKDKEAA